MMDEATIQSLLDETTRKAARHPTQAGILFRCPRAEPSHEQRAILAACVAHVQRIGLRLPPKTGVFWVAGFRQTRAPACVRIDPLRRRFDLAVNVEAATADLAFVLLHELKHLAAAISGEPMTHEAAEQDAERFAERYAAEIRW